MALKRFFNFNKWNINEDIDTDVDVDIPEDTGKIPINVDAPKSKEDNLIEIPSDDADDYDSITLSKKFENRLKELKLNTDNKIEVGDKVVLKDDKKGKLPDEIYKFLKSRDIFDVIRINDKGKLDIGCYQRYIRETDGKKIKKVFYFSSRRFQKLDTLDPVAQFFLSLKHIPKTDLLDYPVDFIDTDDKGNLTFLSRRFYEKGKDPFKSDKRQTAKLMKLMMRIVTKDYYDRTLKQKDIEVFLNKWRMMFDDSYQVVVLEGDDILDAYDHTKISNGWKSSSCANFTSRGNANLDRYKVYTENTENVKCLVVYHKGKIQGRRMMFTGIQTETHGKYKKGDPVILLNYMYGEGGRGSKIDQLMKRWVKDNNAALMEDMYGSYYGSGGERKNIVRMKIQNTRYGQYPPWDGMVVNFKTNEIASSAPSGGNWSSAYNAHYRKGLFK